jgi:hypothetical protein
LSGPSRARVHSRLWLITALHFRIELFAKLVADRLRTHPGYTATQIIPGVGPVLAAVFVAEIGDITHFGAPEQLTSWAGLTPKHHESEPTVHRTDHQTVPGWCDGPRSRPCNGSPRTPASVRSAPWCFTACAITIFWCLAPARPSTPAG